MRLGPVLTLVKYKNDANNYVDAVKSTCTKTHAWIQIKRNSFTNSKYTNNKPNALRY